MQDAGCYGFTLREIYCRYEACVQAGKSLIVQWMLWSSLNVTRVALSLLSIVIIFSINYWHNLMNNQRDVANFTWHCR